MVSWSVARRKACRIRNLPLSFPPSSSYRSSAALSGSRTRVRPSKHAGERITWRAQRACGHVHPRATGGGGGGTIVLFEGGRPDDRLLLRRHQHAQARLLRTNARRAWVAVVGGRETCPVPPSGAGLSRPLLPSGARLGGVCRRFCRVSPTCRGLKKGLSGGNHQPNGRNERGRVP